MVGCGIAAATVWSCSSQQAAEQMPKLAKIAPLLPEPPPPPKVELVEKVEEPRTVENVLDQGCSTTVVKGLSEQIIAEANCLVPDSYAEVPKVPNLVMGQAVFPFMRRAARDALVRTLEKGAKKNLSMRVNSMLRTVAQQYLLYDWYQHKRCGIKLAAEPGTSNHQGGLAIDIRQPARWRTRLAREGFRWLGKRDRWHFDFVGTRTAGAGKGEPTAEAGLDIKAFQRLWNRNHPSEAIAESGVFDAVTAAALRRAPAGGFAIAARCPDLQQAE